MKKNNTLKITVSAMLTALSLIYIWLMPTIDLGVWSFTPFSHAPLFIACLISPYTALMTYLAVVVGFVLKGASYLVWMRAASHLFFVVFMVLYIKFFGLKTKKDIFIVAVLTAILHAFMEIIAVIIGVAAGLGTEQTRNYITFFL